MGMKDLSLCRTVPGKAKGSPQGPVCLQLTTQGCAPHLPGLCLPTQELLGTNVHFREHVGECV